MRLCRLILFVAVLLIGSTASVGAMPGRQDSGWTIERFHAEITIRPDASLLIVEEIDVDFGTLERRGIFREIPVRYQYNADADRVYRLAVDAVTDAQGKHLPYERTRNGANERLRIGDPDRTVSGRQRYRITYRVEHALNAFEGHDELYWNVDGAAWGVPKQAVTATVLPPDGGLERATCFQGRTGATEECRLTRSDGRVEYAATRPLLPGEQLTIVAGLPKGAVAEPRVALEEKPRGLPEYFEVNRSTAGSALLILLGGLALVGRTVWTRGRDRRYTSIYYLTENPEEETRPLFGKDPVVVEYQPPEGMHPAQMGILLDERADRVDVTATIVDLAVRGYLTITELPRDGMLGGLFRQKDWKLTRTSKVADDLLPYERIILDGLFSKGDEVDLSDLKNEYYRTLNQARKQLHADVAERGWFSGNPERVRGIWAAAGLAVAALGGGLIYLLGRFLGGGIVGVPVVLIGLLVLVLSRWMPRRTARGSELLRRTLGFREYINTAEKERQQFNERATIFAEYLPYAIVFGLVDRWARAFREIDTAATAGWYAGTSGFHGAEFSRGIESFSSSVSSTIGSTPGSSGGSGFSGGSSGGGGGGGGGGSW